MQSVKAEVAQGPFSVEDLDRGESAILRFCQRTQFTDELHSLQKGQRAKMTSHLYKFNPILEESILRVGGRLRRAAMPGKQSIPLY